MSGMLLMKNSNIHFVEQSVTVENEFYISEVFYRR